MHIISGREVEASNFAHGHYTTGKEIADLAPSPDLPMAQGFDPMANDVTETEWELMENMDLSGIDNEWVYFNRQVDLATDMKLIDGGKEHGTEGVSGKADTTDVHLEEGWRDPALAQRDRCRDLRGRWA